MINYDLPFDSEAYVHRIGRTGRAGRSGEAILFVHPRERRLLKRLEQATRQPIEAMDVPSNRTINKRRVAQISRADRRGAGAIRSWPSTPSVIEQFQQTSDASPQQIAAALAVIAQGDVPLFMTEELKPASFAKPKAADDRSHSRREPRSFGDAGRTSSPAQARGWSRFALRSATPTGSSRAISSARLPARRACPAPQIGRIAIFNEYSIVDLPQDMPHELFHSLKKVWVSGRQLNISRLGDARRSVADRPGGKPQRKPPRKKSFAKS